MLAIAGLMFTNTTLVALPATIAQLWLLFNASPLSGDGQVVAAVPILPALILVAVLSNRVFKAVKDKVSLADLNVLVGLALGFPLTLTLISWAMLLDAASVFPVDAPPLLAALGRTLLVHVLVLVIGMGSRLWRALCRRFGLPQWIVDANFTALKFLGSVSVAGLLLSVIMMAAHTSSLGQLFSNFHGVGAAGLVLLSLLYLPNGMVGSRRVAPCHRDEAGAAGPAGFCAPPDAPTTRRRGCPAVGSGIARSVPGMARSRTVTRSPMVDSGSATTMRSLASDCSSCGRRTLTKNCT